MLSINKNKERGISLVETLLIVALAAIIVIAGIRFWESQAAKVRVDQTVGAMLHLSKTVKAALQFSNQTQFTSGTLTVNALNEIVDASLDEKYKNGAQVVMPSGNLAISYGGLLIPNPAQNQNFGVNLTLSGLSRKDCALIIGSALNNEFSQIRVNSAVTSQLKTINSGSERSLLLGACSMNGYTNTIRVDIAFNEIFGSENNIVDIADAYVRNPDDISFLGSIDNSAFTGTRACTGGATWDTVTSKCGCPINHRWMGATEGCVPFNFSGAGVGVRAGVCNLNDGLSEATNNCAVLNPSVAAASGTYRNGKHVPAHTVTNNINGANMEAANSTPTPAMTNWIASPAVVEEIGGRAITTPALGAGAARSSNCIVGTRSGNRCQPPATPPVGNW